MRVKEIIANLSATKTTQTTPLYQWDYGQVLKVIGTKITSPIQVHFSIGEEDADVVMAQVENDCLVADIPNELLEKGQYITAYIYYTDEDSGQTVYKIGIPVLSRTKPTDYTPTEHEKTLIEEAIDALEKNLLTVETEDTENGVKITITDRNGQHFVVLYNGKDGQDGISPTVTITEITGGHRLVITDADGTTHSADILDGVKGENGFSPLAEVEQTSAGATIRITDERGTTSASIANGSQGQDGISPTVTITEITGGHRLEITDADGTTHTADIMNGVGQTGPEGPAGKGIASIEYTGQQGYTKYYTLTYTDGETLVLPISDGVDGENGFSPIARVTQTATGATISITDDVETTTASISNGKDGQDGISPTVTITEITGGHRLVITDADGTTHSADILDGEPGSDYVLTSQDKSDIADIVIQQIGSADTTSY